MNIRTVVSACATQRDENQWTHYTSVLFTGRSSKSRLRLGLDHSLAGMANIRFFDDEIH